MTVTLYRALIGAPDPVPADPSALGTVPVRGYRYCEALRMATSCGHYLYPPAALAWEWDGGPRLEVWLDGERLGLLDPGEGIQDPAATAAWDARAPEELRGRLYPMAVRSPVQANFLQIFTGWVARTVPEWGVLLRPPANLPRPAGYDAYEGFIETDRWFGPLFINLALTTTNTRITLRPDWPLCQLQALPRAAYRTTLAVGTWTEADWHAYRETVVDHSRERLGTYAIRTRQRPFTEQGQYDESCESELGR